MITDNRVKEKPATKKQGRYTTAEEAIQTKNATLIALLKKLNVKVVSGS